MQKSDEQCQCLPLNVEAHHARKTFFPLLNLSILKKDCAWINTIFVEHVLLDDGIQFQTQA